MAQLALCYQARLCIHFHFWAAAHSCLSQGNLCCFQSTQNSVSSSRVSLLSPLVSTLEIPCLSGHNYIAFQLAAPLSCFHPFLCLPRGRWAKTKASFEWLVSILLFLTESLTGQWVPLSPQPCPPLGYDHMESSHPWTWPALVRPWSLLFKKTMSPSVSPPHFLYCQVLDLIYPTFFFVYANLLQGNKLVLSTGRRHKTTIRDKKSFITDGKSMSTCIFASLTPKNQEAMQRSQMDTGVHMASEDCWIWGSFRLYYLL